MNISRIVEIIDLCHNILIGNNVEITDILTTIDERLPNLVSHLFNVSYDIISFNNVSISIFIDISETIFESYSITLSSLFNVPYVFITELCKMIKGIIVTDNGGSIDQRLIYFVRHYDLLNPMISNFYSQFNGIYNNISTLSLSSIINYVIKIYPMNVNVTDLNSSILNVFNITIDSLSEAQTIFEKISLPIISLLKLFNLPRDNFDEFYGLLYSSPSSVRFIDVLSIFNIEYNLMNEMHKTVVSIMKNETVSLGEFFQVFPNNANTSFTSLVSNIQSLSNIELISMSDMETLGYSMYDFVFSIMEGMYFMMYPEAMIPDMTPIPTPQFTPLLTPMPTPFMTPIMTPKSTPVPTPFMTPVMTPKRSPFMTPQPSPAPTVIPATPHPVDSLCIGKTSNDILLCPNTVYPVDQSGLSARLDVIKSTSTMNTIDIIIVGSSQVELSLSTLKNKHVTIKGNSELSSILLDFVENPSSLDLSNLLITVKNSSLASQGDLVITVDSLRLNKISGVLLYGSNSDWIINSNDIFTDFSSFGSFKKVNIVSKLSIREGNPTTTAYPNVTYSTNSQLIISTFFTDIKVLVGELLVGIGNNQYINVYGSPITSFLGHQKLNVTGSAQIKSIKSDQFLPKTSISMGNNSVLSFTGSFPQTNGEDPFSLSSNGLCSLQMSGPAPIQYDVGSKLQIGFETAKHVDFGKILDADLSIATESEGSVQSLVQMEDPFQLIN